MYIQTLGILSALQRDSSVPKTEIDIQLYLLYISVMRVGSDTFGDPIFQKDLQN